MWGGAALALLTPLVAMQFTDEVDWNEADFIIMGAMLFLVCGSFELAARRSPEIAYRSAAGLALVAAFLLIWINLAVGVIGSEDNPTNLMYAGVLAIGIIGAFVSRFRASGMARAMVATAMAQALVAAIALVAMLSGDDAEPIGGVTQIVALNGLFVVLWLLSAWLFGKTERVRTTQAADASGALR